MSVKNKMERQKWCLIVISLITLIIIGGFLFLTKSRIARAEETTATTFPVDKAGIAAYVKLDNVENINLENFANACDSIEELRENYIIGKIKVENAVGFSEPHIYVGADGWIVAYYLKTEEAAKVMQWKNYAGTINTTTLKDGIDIICQKTGMSYSQPVKYYDFEFPEANKMSLIVDSNDFYVRVPGTLYEASYGIWLKNGWCGRYSGDVRSIGLKVDENIEFVKILGYGYTCSDPFLLYGNYDLSHFSTSTTHRVAFIYNGFSPPNSSFVSALIYKE